MWDGIIKYREIEKTQRIDSLEWVRLPSFPCPKFCIDTDEKHIRAIKGDGTKFMNPRVNSPSEKRRKKHIKQVSENVDEFDRDIETSILGEIGFPKEFDLITLEERYRGYDVIVKMVCVSLSIEKYNWYCGYVRVPEDHKNYKVPYQKLERQLTVHGGLSFSGELGGLQGYYIGFDCAHASDSPEVQDEGYTLNECLKLVDQLIEVEE